MTPVAAARIAAALVYKREIISVGICQYKTHTFQKTYGSNEKAIFLHAETDTIKNAINRKIDTSIISKSTLYVVRQKKIQGQWVQGLAKPCLGCQKCIISFDIKNIIYTKDCEGYEEL